MGDEKRPAPRWRVTAEIRAEGFRIPRFWAVDENNPGDRREIGSGHGWAADGTPFLIFPIREGKGKERKERRRSFEVPLPPGNYGARFFAMYLTLLVREHGIEALARHSSEGKAPSKE